MPGSAYLVRPGSPQQFSGAPIKNAIIWNNDDVNSVWLSSVQAMGPELGMLLQPQAYVTWKGAQVWGCVDTGVTQPVQVIISNDVDSIENPVGIAEAIALLGVPSVFLSTFIVGNASASLSLLALASKADVPIGMYASLIIFAYAAPSGTVAPCIIQVVQAFAPSELFADDSFYATSEDTSNNGFLAFEVPVSASYLTIKNWTPSQAIGLVVLGTNRLIPERRFLGYNRPPTKYFLNSAVVGGTVYTLPVVGLPAGVTQEAMFAANGQVQVTINASNAGTLFLRYMRADGVIEFLALGAVGATAATYTFDWWGYVGLSYEATANSATPNVTAFVAPGPSI